MKIFLKIVQEGSVDEGQVSNEQCLKWIVSFISHVYSTQCLGLSKGKKIKSCAYNIVNRIYFLQKIILFCEISRSFHNV